MKELKTIRDLLLALLEGYEIENYFEPQSIWESVDSICFDTRYLDDEEALQGRYRIKLTKPYIDWSQVSDIFNCLARDKIGTCFLYENSPEMANEVWLGPPDSAFTPAEGFKSLKVGTCDWTESLVERPINKENDE